MQQLMEPSQASLRGEFLQDVQECRHGDGSGGLGNCCWIGDRIFLSEEWEFYKWPHTLVVIWSDLRSANLYFVVPKLVVREPPLAILKEPPSKPPLRRTSSTKTRNDGFFVAVAHPLPTLWQSLRIYRTWPWRWICWLRWDILVCCWSETQSGQSAHGIQGSDFFSSLKKCPRSSTGQWPHRLMPSYLPVSLPSCPYRTFHPEKNMGGFGWGGWLGWVAFANRKSLGEMMGNWWLALLMSGLWFPPPWARPWLL